MDEYPNPKFKIGKVVWFILEDIALGSFTVCHIKIESIHIHNISIEYEGIADYASDWPSPHTVFEENMFESSEALLEYMDGYMQDVDNKCRIKDKESDDEAEV
ncbi:hypothetical protein LCGC14_2582620 [marine sediment metagenome]|uniref:Uncharacterized protein n=1 Tax=marine sediment metagenome TaxID=412755 RepID=A0A0F9CQ40_9ZZZZ